MDTKTIMELIISAFLIIGALFSLSGSIGFIRFPDVYCCMHALSKPVTIGIASLMTGYLIFLEYTGLGFSTQGVLAVVFIIVTVPIGSHMIGKACYHNGIPLWEHSVIDQLHEDEVLMWFDDEDLKSFDKEL